MRQTHSKIRWLEVLQQNQDKIDWANLSENPSIFELDYNALNEHSDIYKEELFANALHPSRIKQLINTGATIGELDKYI